jgi:hypothetical protein
MLLLWCGLVNQRSMTDARSVPVWRQSRCVPDSERRLAAALSKPAPGRHESIEAKIGDEIAVVEGVMVSDLREDEHLVRPEAEEVRGVIEVRIGEPCVHAIAVGERAFDVGDDLGLGSLRGRRGGGRFAFGV